MIIGAFAAGSCCTTRRSASRSSGSRRPVGHLVVPVFFAVVGASVDLGALAAREPLTIGGALIAVAIVGKFAAGYAPFWFRGRKALVGAAMIPRGEVGLIFAQMGLVSGALSPALFGAVALMVLATTFVSPPLIAAIARRSPRTVSPPMGARVDLPGQGGIDDLVYGVYDEHANDAGRRWSADRSERVPVAASVSASPARTTARPGARPRRTPWAPALTDDQPASGSR
jgi:hypothetical protein